MYLLFFSFPGADALGIVVVVITCRRGVWGVHMFTDGDKAES